MTEKYPYKCDFYLPEIDLYIEYQGFPGHNNHPFDANNEQDLKIVEEWKQKSEEINYKGEKKKQYLGYINTWTISDPKKRECAKNNNLNWLEFFTLDEFNIWFSTI